MSDGVERISGLEPMRSGSRVRSPDAPGLSGEFSEVAQILGQGIAPLLEGQWIPSRLAATLTRLKDEDPKEVVGGIEKLGDLLCSSELNLRDKLMLGLALPFLAWDGSKSSPWAVVVMRQLARALEFKGAGSEVIQVRLSVSLLYSIAAGNLADDPPQIAEEKVLAEAVPILEELLKVEDLHGSAVEALELSLRIVDFFSKRRGTRRKARKILEERGYFDRRR